MDKINIYVGMRYKLREDKILKKHRELTFEVTDVLFEQAAVNGRYLGCSCSECVSNKILHNFDEIRCFSNIFSDLSNIKGKFLL